MAIKAARGGSTANSWYQVGIPVRVQSHLDDLVLRLELDSKGGGVTDIRITVERDSYEEILLAMLETDFDKAARAYANACQKWRRKNARATRP